MHARSILCFAIALAACRSDPIDTSSTDDALIQDAVHNGGRAGFYFLPPMVAPAPLPPVFDPSLQLIARLEGSGASHAFALIAGDSHYSGLLDTDGLGLDPAVTYRLRVLAGEIELGFADVIIYASHARSAASDEYFELVDGKKLRIKVYANRCATVTCSGTECRAAGTCDPSFGT